MPFVRFFGESTARGFAYDFNLPLGSKAAAIQPAYPTLARPLYSIEIGAGIKMMWVNLIF
jgi:hypothetical protein